MTDMATVLEKIRKEEEDWCMALHGNHDEHQCHRKPGHVLTDGTSTAGNVHECYCGVWW